MSGSLALLADAGHMLSDATGIGLALLAATFAARPATLERTFGYQRAEILAALANALLLFVVAAVGLVANTISLLLLRRGQRESLNLRGAYLEVAGDLLGRGP